MIIIGAKGFAKEVLDILEKNGEKNIHFFDDINIGEPNLVYNKYIIYRTLDEVIFHFKNVSNKFTLGLGNPLFRKQLADKFDKIGGLLSSTISKFAIIGMHDVYIGDGSNVMHNAIISNSTHIGIGCLIYFNVQITHDCEIGDFVELSPNATILGRVKIGNNTIIGAGATILPDIVIGSNVIVGAGSVVLKDIPDNFIVAGVPAKLIRENY